MYSKKRVKEKNESSKKRESIFYKFRQGVPTLLCLPEANFFSRACVWQA